MTIAEWLVMAMVELKKAGITKGRSDALILLSDLFQKDKSWVHSHPDHILDELQVRELDYKLKRRCDRIPLAYIRGFSEFYGRIFTVNSKVMIPRPESESFIEILKSLDFERPHIADVGTGSGILGVTAALEVRDAEVDLYDIDADALAVAHHNARQYDLELVLEKSDLLQGLADKKYDIILANLPYVPEGLITSREITKEPSTALFSGEDGMDHYKKFWMQISNLPLLPGYILTECLESQHIDNQVMAAKTGYTLSRTEILVQLFKKN